MTEGIPTEGCVGMLMVLFMPVHAVDLPVLALQIVVFLSTVAVTTGTLVVVGAEVVVGGCEVVEGGLEVAATRPVTVYAAAQAAKSMLLGQHQVWALVS